MGCDIHPAIEFRQDGQWKALLFPNKNFGKEWNEEPELVADLDILRDYDLFAILGNVRNVRNGRSAAMNTGDGFDPMSDGRGVPEDATPETLKALSDEHSATWVSLTEILSYDWTRSTVSRGVVDAVPQNSCGPASSLTCSNWGPSMASRMCGS